MPPASHIYLADSPGHMTIGWLSSSSSFILELDGGPGSGKASQVIVFELNPASTNYVFVVIVIVIM